MAILSSFYLHCHYYRHNQFRRDYSSSLRPHDKKKMDIHLCKEEKFVYGRNIKAPAQSHVIQSMSPFCKVASIVGLLLLLLILLLQSVFLGRSFTPDARDPCRNCDVNQDLNNLRTKTNIDFDHWCLSSLKRITAQRRNRNTTWSSVQTQKLVVFHLV